MAANSTRRPLGGSRRRRGSSPTWPDIRLDFLLFDYPLAGTYEFSVDAYDGPFAQGSLTHNGLVLEPSGGVHQPGLHRRR